jgi:taurine dioxygenase
MKELPPDGGGNTLFANMYRAYETLSAPLQRLCEGLLAVHDGAQVYGGRFGQTPKEGGFPRNEHPVVRTHPVTGRKALYVNRNFTTRIVGLKKNESDALLEMLYRHGETPEFQCRFAWQPNSIAFWDNRAAQHHAMWDYFPHKRLGYRVTVKGDKPFFRA